MRLMLDCGHPGPEGAGPWELVLCPSCGNRNIIQLDAPEAPADDEETPDA